MVAILPFTVGTVGTFGALTTMQGWPLIIGVLLTLPAAWSVQG